MIEGCRGWGKQCRGNNPSFPGREHRTRVRDKERDGKWVSQRQNEIQSVCAESSGGCGANYLKQKHLKPLIKQVACTWQAPKGKERGREAAVGGGEWDKEGAGGCPYLLFTERTVCGRRQRESWRKEGAQERKRASREQAVCVVCEGEYIWNPVSGLHSCRQPLHQPLLRCTTWAKGPCSNPGLFPGSVLSCWGWWGSWCRAQTSSITNTRTWYELCLQCRANAPTSRAFTASGTVWRVATSMSWSSAITRATTKHVSNTWSVVWQPSDMLYNDFMLHFIPKWIIGRKRDGWNSFNILII